MPILNSLFSSIEISVFWGGQKTFEDPYTMYTDPGPQAINPVYSVYGSWWVSSFHRVTLTGLNRVLHDKASTDIKNTAHGTSIMDQTI